MGSTHSAVGHGAWTSFTEKNIQHYYPSKLIGTDKWTEFIIELQYPAAHTSHSYFTIMSTDVALNHGAGTSLFNVSYCCEKKKYVTFLFVVHKRHCLKIVCVLIKSTEGLYWSSKDLCLDHRKTSTTVQNMMHSMKRIT